MRTDGKFRLDGKINTVVLERGDAAIYKSIMLIAPERSGGASYSETGVSNDLGVRVCVRPEKTTETPKICVPVTLTCYLQYLISRFSRCRRKVRLRGEGMICRDPKKVDFFQNLNHSNYAYIRRPRTIRSSLQPS